MTNTKPYHIYMALTHAVDDFKARTGVTTRDFAQRVGFTSETPENELSNHLNPRSSKNVSHEREYMIMCELDDKAREVYFRMRCKEWHIVANSEAITEVLPHEVVCLDTMADNAIIESDEVFACIKKVERDKHGKVTKKAWKKIRKEAREAVRENEKIVDTADLALRGM